MKCESRHWLKKISMAAVWLHDGSVKGTGMLKNRDYYFFFIGIHIFIILTIVVYSANVTG